MRSEHPELTPKAVKFLLHSHTTYICENWFSAFVPLKSKYRNKLNIEPDWKLYGFNQIPNLWNSTGHLIKWLSNKYANISSVNLLGMSHTNTSTSTFQMYSYVFVVVMNKMWVHLKQLLSFYQSFRYYVFSQVMEPKTTIISMLGSAKFFIYISLTRKV
jgi:hypothetical protein